MDATECSGCGGSGCQAEDRFDRRGEHYTVEVACTECGGVVENDEDYLEAADEHLVEDGQVSTESPC